MDTKSLMQFIRWAAINGSMSTFAYFGFVRGVEGAANIAIVMIWMMIALSPVSMLKDFQSSFNGQPQWFKAADTVYDIAMTIFLLWIGMIWTGVFYLIQTLIMAAVKYGEATDNAD